MIAVSQSQRASCWSYSPSGQSRYCRRRRDVLHTVSRSACCCYDYPPPAARLRTTVDKLLRRRRRDDRRTSPAHRRRLCNQPGDIVIGPSRPACTLFIPHARKSAIAVEPMKKQTKKISYRQQAPLRPVSSRGFWPRSDRKKTV